MEKIKLHIHLIDLYEMTKITNSIQSHKSNRKYKSENGRTRTSECIRGGIRCHGGVSIPCWSITPAVSPFSRLGNTWLKLTRLNVDGYQHLCLFVCLLPPEQFFNNLAAVISTSERAANLDLWLTFMAFSIEGSFTCYTYCDTGLRFIRSHPMDQSPPQRPTVGFEPAA
jgi:hypothetical protein